MVFQKGHQLRKGLPSPHPFQKGNQLSKGRPPWCKGKKLSEEIRLKMSKAHKGKKWSEETRAKSIGRSLSEETRKKISDALTGRKSPFKGIPRTEEVKKKISAGNKGKLAGEKSPKWKGGVKARIMRYKQKNRGKIRAADKEWREKNRDKTRSYKSRRRHELGFIPLNSWFAHSQAHHINRACIIYIPEELHLNTEHQLNKPETMKKINRIAIHYLNPAIMPVLK